MPSTVECATPDPKKSILNRVLSQSQSTPLTPRSSSLINLPASPCLEKLGYGTGVDVFLYERSPMSGGKFRSPWAIKKVNKKNISYISERLEKEANILKKLDHPNIIGYRAFKRNADGTKVLAIENGEKALGDMIEELEEMEDGLGPFEPECILKVVKAVASALDYLHTKHHLLHGDIKSSNVLVKGDFEAIKICDFGVVLELDDELVAKDEDQTYVGTEPWSANEVFDEDGVISNKTDIFALGCVIYEMLALSPPHLDLLPTEGDDDDSFDESEYNAALGTRPKLPSDLDLDSDEYDKVLSIFYACTAEDPTKRPSAAMILRSLDD